MRLSPDQLRADGSGSWFLVQAGREPSSTTGTNGVEGTRVVEKSKRVDTLNALNAHLDKGTTADAGGIMRAPMSDFTCPRLLAQEQDVFFRNTPLCMGLSSELPEPNTYWSDDATGTPVLMVRDGDGCFRAYANVCRHRGSRIVAAGRGAKARFTCPFHAWTYGNDGRLLAVNKSRHFGEVPCGEWPLIALPAAEMHGTLWVRPTPGDPIDEDECLAGLQDELIHWRLSDYPFAGRQALDARMNWKLGLDTFGELYHINTLHAQTAAKEVVGDLQTFDGFGKNLRMVAANQKLNLMRMLMPSVERWPYTQITSTLYFLYPNVILVVGGAGVDLFRIFPLEDSTAKSRTIHAWYVDPKIQKHMADNAMSYEDRLGMSMEVVENEDYAVAQEIQINAERGIQSEIVLGRNEAALQHFRNAHRMGLGHDVLPVE